MWTSSVNEGVLIAGEANAERVPELSVKGSWAVFCLIWKPVRMVRHRAQLRKGTLRKCLGEQRWYHSHAEVCKVKVLVWAKLPAVCGKDNNKGRVGWTDISPPLPASWTLGWTVRGVRFPLANPKSSWLEQKALLHHKAVLSGEDLISCQKYFWLP